MEEEHGSQSLVLAKVTERKKSSRYVRKNAMAQIFVSFVQGRWGAGVQKVFSASYAQKLIDSMKMPY